MSEIAPPDDGNGARVKEKTSGLRFEEKTNDSQLSSADRWSPPPAWVERLIEEYSGDGGGVTEALPAGADPKRVAAAIFTFNEDESVKILESLIQEHQTDYTIDQRLLSRCQDLIKGHEACEMEKGEWAYVVCKTAGTVDNWSSYAEVRVVTLPYDDPEEPCESFRVYLIGFFWVCCATAVNTFFNPRQPGISIPGSVIQMLCVPMGRGMAYLLPDWGLNIRGTRYTLNPGPWSAKEQLLVTLISGADSIGNFTGLLVMRLPIFFNQRWVGFGFGIMLALANQVFGLGMAGILRRLTVYPQQAVWPGSLQTLALNRALIYGDNYREVVNGWRITRFKFFAMSSIIFLLYYWLPNKIIGAIRLFNWMTWIDPKNKNLAIVTGSYGGMGFNPWSTFDPNVSGGGAMGAPFFAQFQQYVMRVISGLIIIIGYYSNISWAAYMPINSNGSFDNKGKPYNVSSVLGPNSDLDIEKYKAYGPPYYAVANLFTTGATYLYYTFSIVYVYIEYWGPLKKAFVGIIVNTWKRQSIYTGFSDGQTRMMKKYKEVPEWWYSIIFAFGFIVSILAVTAWPTKTPWWSVLVVVGVGSVLTIPWVIVESIASTGIAFNAIWEVLPGIIWPGNPLAQLVILMLGAAFEQLAGGFTSSLKYAHYAKIPPRAMFRSHVAATVVNCFIYVAMLEVMVIYFNNDSTLCQWNNKEHMVCSYANAVHASTISFGTFGTNNMFKLYPALPYCFLIGAILGLLWILGKKAAPHARQHIQSRLDPHRFSSFDKYIWKPLAAILTCLNPAIALSGALGWAGNNNLTYATFGIYTAWIFQFYLKRRYTAWWGKYAFLVFAGLSVGSAISGLISTLIFSFGAGKKKNFNWWGNDVATHGFDYQLYINNASLKALPDLGYFGLDPDQYPLDW